ncbi:monovalent cation/H(+) antiporter subunit G [Fodinicurvata sp. EGI_FJ10296]|uniref:monovalent cation/H(+) antiporter subunit G n=1 Tax=Fodinicurvata sp. EGI_FJ10296 TaxID=3231908 RepID=UPI00345438EB
MTIVLEIMTAVLLVSGGFFTFVAGVGVVRLPDILMRMHASTKAGTLGVGLIFLGLALYFGELSVASRSIAAIVFLLITAPVAAHMIGRAAYKTGIQLTNRTVIDEYQAACDRGEAGGDLQPDFQLTPTDIPETETPPR